MREAYPQSLDRDERKREKKEKKKKKSFHCLSSFSFHLGRDERLEEVFLFLFFFSMSGIVNKERAAAAAAHSSIF